LGDDFSVTPSLHPAIAGLFFFLDFKLQDDKLPTVDPNLSLHAPDDRSLFLD
jgi:hypothetical protein